MPVYTTLVPYCRNPQIRYQAIILLQISKRYQGLFDGLVAARIAEKSHGC